MFSDELWENIFGCVFFGSLFLNFVLYYILRARYRKCGKSVKHLAIKVALCMLSANAVVFLMAPGVPIWAKILVLIGIFSWIVIWWRIYVHNYNTIRRNMGQRDWDWDWGGPKQDNRDSGKDVKKTSATEKK